MAGRQIPAARLFARLVEVDDIVDAVSPRHTGQGWRAHVRQVSVAAVTRRIRGISISRLARDAEDVHRDDAGEDVLVLAEEIGRIEQARQVPIDGVVHIEHQSEQLLRAFVAIVLEVHERPIGVDRLARALHDVDLHPFDIHFEEMAGRRSRLSSVSSGTGSPTVDVVQRDCRRNWPGGRIDCRNAQRPGLRPTAACERERWSAD